jgi:hypothetical protein
LPIIQRRATYERAGVGKLTEVLKLADFGGKIGGKQKKLHEMFKATIKPDLVDVDLYDEDIIYHKKDFWGVFERCTSNLVIYREQFNKDTLYYVADFLIFLRKRFNIIYGTCKGRKNRYDFFSKLYGADFIKEKDTQDGESVYRFRISDNALKVSRAIKCGIIRQKLFTTLKNHI